MTARRLGARRRAYRRGQIAVLFALATLVVLSCVVGPLYERAVEQATVRSVLLGADPVSRSLSLEVAGGTTPHEVPIPSGTRRLLTSPIRGIELPITFAGGTFAHYGGLTSSLVERDDECAHLTFTAGGCPSAPNTVAISDTAARALNVHVGDSYLAVSPNYKLYDYTKLHLTVAGVYRRIDPGGTYWFGHPYSSRAGVQPGTFDQPPSTDALIGAPGWLVARAARLIKANGPARPTYLADISLRADRVHLDDLAALRAGLAAVNSPHQHVVLVVNSGLPQLLDEIDTGRRDARRIVLAVASQLALLAVLTFGVVVAAAAAQRRPELALARLRGRSRRRATLVFGREIGVLAVVAAVPGIVIAWVATLLACHARLVAGVSPELRWPVVAGAAVAVVAVLAIVAVVGLRTCAQPVTDLLRQVPARSKAGAALAEVAVGVAALAGLAVSRGGSSGGLLAALTPTFVAVLAGLLVSRLLVPIARVSGRRRLERGNVASGLALLGIARRGSARLAVTALCVAGALAVFAGQQWSVAARNREQRAAAEVGAAVVLDVKTSSAQRLVHSVLAADPSQRYASAVATVVPPGVDSGAVLAVQPASFRRVASWGRASYAPTASEFRTLESPGSAPTVTVRGTHLSYRLSDAAYVRLDTTPGQPHVQVQLVLQRVGGAPVALTSPTLPSGTPRTFEVSGDVECATGCRVVGLQILRGQLDSAPVRIEFTVSMLSAGEALRIGDATQWGSVTPPEKLAGTDGRESARAADATGGGLRVTAVDEAGDAALQYLDVPIALPALRTSKSLGSTDDLGHTTAPDTGGGQTRIQLVGRVPFLPAAGSRALLVNLDQMALVKPDLDALAHPAVWLATDDPGRERALVATLKQAGIVVVRRTTQAHRADQLAHTAPGWSTELAPIAGVLAALLALALLVLIVMTSRRARQQDVAALLLNGMQRRLLRRSTVLEIVLLVTTGLLGGLLAGLVGAHLSLHAIPVFTHRARVPLPASYSIDWAWLFGSIVFSAVLLMPAAVALGRRVVARTRVR